MSASQVKPWVTFYLRGNPCVCLQCSISTSASDQQEDEVFAVANLAFRMGVHVSIVQGQYDNQHQQYLIYLINGS